MTWGLIGIVMCSAWLGFWLGIKLRDWQNAQIKQIQSDLDIMDKEYRRRVLKSKGQIPLTLIETDEIIYKTNLN